MADTELLTEARAIYAANPGKHALYNPITGCYCALGAIGSAAGYTNEQLLSARYVGHAMYGALERDKRVVDAVRAVNDWLPHEWIGHAEYDDDALAFLTHVNDISDPAAILSAVDSAIHTTEET